MRPWRLRVTPCDWHLQRLSISCPSIHFLSRVFWVLVWSKNDPFSFRHLLSGYFKTAIKTCSGLLWLKTFDKIPFLTLQYKIQSAFSILLYQEMQIRPVRETSFGKTYGYASIRWVVSQAVFIDIKFLCLRSRNSNYLDNVKVVYLESN